MKAEEAARQCLKDSFNRNVKPLMNSLDFDTLEGDTKQGYNWIIEAMQEYAIEQIKLDRIKVSEAAKASIQCYEDKPCPCYSSADCYANTAVIDKQSILNLPIELQ